MDAKISFEQEFYELMSLKYINQNSWIDFFFSTFSPNCAEEIQTQQIHEKIIHEKIHFAILQVFASCRHDFYR